MLALQNLRRVKIVVWLLGLLMLLLLWLLRLLLRALQDLCRHLLLLLLLWRCRWWPNSKHVP